MVAQLQPREQCEETESVAPHDLRTNPRARNRKKKRGAVKRRAGIASWTKRAARFVALIASWRKRAAPSVVVIGGVVGIFATVWHLNPSPPPPPQPAEPRIEVDERATLIRSSKKKQLELRVNLTLLNRGGQTALIPRPTVSLGDADIPPNDLHFKFADGTSDVIFPVFLSEGASTFAKQIICSIAEGRDGEWGRAGLLRINLDFKPEGHDPISRCLVFIPPVADGNQPPSQDESKCFTITDNCADFGEGFKRR